MKTPTPLTRLFYLILFALSLPLIAHAQTYAYNGAKWNLIIDVRTPEEFAAGHIDGAINIPYDQIDANLPALKKAKKDENILVYYVPGSFELTFGSSQLVKSGKVDAVIALGCVVRGDTPHFDYVCAGATQGITELNATTDTPIIYGLITTNNMQQAEDRAGGKLGNKGDECAITAIKMIDFICKLKK